MTGLLDIPADQYHADQISDGPTLSASIAHVLTSKSPRHAWHNHPRLNPAYERQTESKFDLGSAVHEVLLLGEDSIYVCQYPDWRTNAAKEAREEARQYGRIPLLAKDAERVQAMVVAAREQLDRKNVTPTPFTDGVAEQTITWQEDGVQCRARLDWIHTGNRCVSDYKSTSASANPKAWRKTMVSIGADVQVAFHSRGLMKVTGQMTWPDWHFAVQETYPPYELSVIGLDPASLRIADAKVERALRIWKECLTADRWPGYPDEVAYVEPLPWAEADLAALEDMDEVAA